LEHLLFHLPYRYQNKTSFGQLNQARIGDEILVQLTIERITIFADFYLTKTLDNIATHQPLLLILIKMEKSQ
jgi:RecG-like helicase